MYIQSIGIHTNTGIEENPLRVLGICKQFYTRSIRTKAYIGIHSY